MELVATQREFSAYGPSHWVVLGVFVIGAAASDLDRTQADRIAGPTPRPRPGGSDRGGIHRGARLQTDPAHHRQFGAAAAVRRRRADGRLRFVVAATLGLCAHLLLGPRAQLTGVDHTGRRHARGRRARFPPPSFRHVLYAARARRVGGHLSHVGASDAADVARATASRSSRPSHGRSSPSPSTRSREPTTATSTGNPPPHHCWTY